MRSGDANHGTVGILGALPGELGSWAGLGESLSSEAGLELRRVSSGGQEVLTCVAGVGKVAAARAAEALIRAGARRALLIVGTCGALERSIPSGALVHCKEAVQADLGVREGRVSTPDAAWSEAWRGVAQGVEAVFLTSDRAIFSPWRRWRARRACAGPCVAEMETAAAAACATAWESHGWL